MNLLKISFIFFVFYGSCAIAQPDFIPHSELNQHLEEDWEKIKIHIDPALNILNESDRSLRIGARQSGYDQKLLNDFDSQKNYKKFLNSQRDLPIPPQMNREEVQDLRKLMDKSYDREHKNFNPLKGKEFLDHIEVLFSYVESVLENDLNRDDNLIGELKKQREITLKDIESGKFNYLSYLLLGQKLSTFANSTCAPLLRSMGRGDQVRKPKAENLNNISAIEIKGVRQVFEALKWSFERVEQSDFLNICLISLQKYSLGQFNEAVFLYNYWPSGLGFSMVPADSQIFSPAGFYLHDVVHYLGGLGGKFPPHLLDPILRAIAKIKNQRTKKLFEFLVFDWTHEIYIFDPHHWNRKHLFATDKIGGPVYFAARQVENLLDYWFKRKWLPEDVQAAFADENYEEGFKIFLQDLYNFFDFTEAVLQSTHVEL